MGACPSCGHDNPEGGRFCSECGGRLETQPARGREIRKVVTVLFCDVTGSTALGERLDPESLRRVMTRYFERMQQVLESHGGTVEKFIGDAVMAVFGIPVLHEDDAVRAVRAARDMQVALEKLNADLESEWGVSIATRIGVNTGEVVAGDPSARLKAHLGDLSAFAAARLSRNDDRRVPPDSVDDLDPRGRNRQLLRIVNARSPLQADAPFPDGHLKSFFDGPQVLENGRALGGTAALLEDHGEPARRGSAITQHRLRKQRSDPGHDVVHILILPRKRTFLLQCTYGKPMEFERQVKEFIRSIPQGKVATYAQVAALAGNYRAARQVARVLHSSSEKDRLPWHRVINSRGWIALAPGRGFEEQRKLLRAEGVKVTRGGRIDLTVFFWEPAGKPFQGMARRLEEHDDAARAKNGYRPSKKQRHTP